MYRSENDWTEVLWIVGKSSRVWNRLGKLLRREGTEPRVSAVIIERWSRQSSFFGAETWVLSEAISRELGGVTVVFLRQITGQREVLQEESN